MVGFEWSVGGRAGSGGGQAEEDDTHTQAVIGFTELENPLATQRGVRPVRKKICRPT